MKEEEKQLINKTKKAKSNLQRTSKMHNIIDKIEIKQEKGITLIALVITIVILIILATVTLNVVLGEGGLIDRAQEEKQLTEQAQTQEQEELKGAEEYKNGVLAGTGTTNPPGEKSEVEQAIENKTKYIDTTPITDDLDNTVYIPGGFHLATDSGTKVEEGIVIEDDNGNQFVWIPTGTYNVTTEVDKDGTQDGKLTNELTRRQWAGKNVEAEPTPVNGDSVINSYYYGEGDSRSVAYGEIDAFLASAKPVSEGGHGGFYIGRYEQGTGNVCKAGVDAYVSVTRDQAKAKAEAMYSSNGEIKATSQLISSYAWDTALNFICQTNEKGYLLATTTNSLYGNIGTGSSGKTQTGGYEEDCYSNIYDFLGNCLEWTTESSSIYNYPCVARGGSYHYSGHYVASRGSYGTSHSYTDISFRSQLYV